MPHAVVLRIPVNGDKADVSWITDALGECARELEAHEADEKRPPLGLVPDKDDPGRFAWSIVTESYA